MWSNIKALLATALIMAGVATFAYQGITFATRRRDLGRNAVPSTVERAGGIPLPVIVGAISLVAGIALLLMDTQDFKRAATKRLGPP